MLLVVLLCLSVSVCVLWVCWWLALMCSEEIWAFFAGSDFFRGTRVLSKLWHTHTLTALTKLCISLSVCHTLLLCGDWPLAQLLTHFPPSPSSTCSEHHHTHTHTQPQYNQQSHKHTSHSWLFSLMKPDVASAGSPRVWSRYQSFSPPAKMAFSHATLKG